jgi:predicted RNA binding protein YcfA (HicA-like mRNA interferase family)
VASTSRPAGTAAEAYPTAGWDQIAVSSGAGGTCRAALAAARIVRALEKAGFEVVSTRGSHCKLRHVSPPRIVIVPLYDEVRPGTLASVLPRLA